MNIEELDKLKGCYEYIKNNIITNGKKYFDIYELELDKDINVIKGQKQWILFYKYISL